MSCPALLLPDDLSDAERATVARLRAEADAKAALAFNVRREVEKLVRRGLSVGDAIRQVGDDKGFPVSVGIAYNIWYRRRGWEV